MFALQTEILSAVKTVQVFKSKMEKHRCQNVREVHYLMHYYWISLYNFCNLFKKNFIAYNQTDEKTNLHYCSWEHRTTPTNPSQAETVKITHTTATVLNNRPRNPQRMTFITPSCSVSFIMVNVFIYIWSSRWLTDNNQRINIT